MTLSEAKALSPDDVLNAILAILGWDVTTRNDNWCFHDEIILGRMARTWREIPKLDLELTHELEEALDDREYALFCGHLVALHGAKRVVSAPADLRGRAVLLVKSKQNPGEGG